MVLCNVFCSAEAVREVLQQGERTASDPLCGKNYPLNSLPICIGAADITDCDAVCQQTLHRRVVAHQQLVLTIVSPQHPQEIKMLLCLLNGCCSLGSPCEVSRDYGSEEFESLGPLYTGLSDYNGTPTHQKREP